MKIQPKRCWVMVRPEDKRSSTPSGIILPETREERGHSVGVVLSAPTEYWSRDEGTLSQTEMPVSAGDRVVYRDYLKSINTIEYAGGPVCFIDITDIELVIGEDVHVGD